MLMSRLEMYKPQSKLQRNNRSSSPILESKLVNKLSSKSFLQVPKNSLVYYKKLSKKLSPSKKDSPIAKLRETLGSKPTKRGGLKANESSQNMLLPRLKYDENFSRTDISDLKDQSQLLTSKTTLKLLKKIKITGKNPETLPKLSQRTAPSKCMVGPVRKKQAKEQSATWSDTGSLSAWETESIV